MMLRFTSSFVTEDRKQVSRWWTRLIALAGVGMVFILYVLGSRTTVDRLSTEQSQTSQVVGELVASTTVGQTFIAEYPALSRIEVRLATYARRNNGSLMFHLLTPNATADMVTLVLDVAEIKDNTYHSFEFPPIEDSAGQAFYFYLEAPKATPNNAITVWGTTEEAYPEGKAVLQGVPGHGVRDLTFRLRYSPTWQQTIGIVLGLLANHKPWVWGNPWVYVLLGVSYLLLLYVLFIQMTQSTFSERENREK